MADPSIKLYFSDKAPSNLLDLIGASDVPIKLLISNSQGTDGYKFLEEKVKSSVNTSTILDDNWSWDSNFGSIFSEEVLALNNDDSNEFFSVADLFN